MTRSVPMRVLDAPSNWQWLDPAAARIKRVVDATIRARSVRDALYGKAIGHPTHPPLAQAALSGWTGAAALAARELLTEDPGGTNEKGRALLGLVGLASAGPAVLAGWNDWSQLHEDQQRTGLVHASIMGTAASISVAARLTSGRRRSAWLDLGAGLVATLGGAVGGHLAYRWSAGPNHAEAFPHLAQEGWTRVCRAQDLGADQLRPSTVGDEPIVVGRDGDRVFAMADRCSHLAGPLHEGEVASVRGVRCLVCPWHGSAFALDDGAAMGGPAFAPQPTLEVRVAFGWIDVRPIQLPGVAGR